MNDAYVGRINSARSPDELKSALVESLAELWAAIEQKPDDPWATGWEAPANDPPWGAGPEAQTGFDRNARLDAIAAVQAQLDAATDPEDIEALTAKLRLLNDDGQAISLRKPDGHRARIEGDGNRGQVDLPEVSVAKKARRYEWAMKNKLHEFLTGSVLERNPELAAETYAKGGPMWLYLGNRDAIMQMPHNWRLDMVEDVQEDSPAEAHELARDILKREDTLDLKSAAAQRALMKADEYA